MCCHTPAAEQVILEENVTVPDPPVIERMEVETTEAATTNDAEATDILMAEDNVELEANVVPEAHV